MGNKESVSAGKNNVQLPSEQIPATCMLLKAELKVKCAVKVGT